MAAGTEHNEYVSYPMFKGLQKPLEFMGIQGRYITWAACAVGGAIVAFIVGYVAIGFVAALIMCTAVLAFGGVMTFLKRLVRNTEEQRQSLGSSHKEDTGTYDHHNLLLEILLNFCKYLILRNY